MPLTKTSTTKRAKIDPTTAGITVLMSEFVIYFRWKNMKKCFTLRTNDGVCISVLGDFERLNLNPAKSQLALGVELDVETLCAQKGLKKAWFSWLFNVTNLAPFGVKRCGDFWLGSIREATLIWSLNFDAIEHPCQIFVVLNPILVSQNWKESHLELQNQSVLCAVIEEL